MMMRIAKESDLVRLVEDEQDILTERFNRWKSRYEDIACPRCGSTTRPEYDAQRMLQQGTVTARLLCRCNGCDCLFEPDLGMIVEMGNLGKLEPAIPIVRPSED